MTYSKKRQVRVVVGKGIFIFLLVRLDKQINNINIITRIVMGIRLSITLLLLLF